MWRKYASTWFSKNYIRDYVFYFVYTLTTVYSKFNRRIRVILDWPNLNEEQGVYHMLVGLGLVAASPNKVLCLV